MLNQFLVGDYSRIDPYCATYYLKTCANKKYGNFRKLKIFTLPVRYRKIFILPYHLRLVLYRLQLKSDFYCVSVRFTRGYRNRDFRTFDVPKRDEKEEKTKNRAR